MTIASNNSFRFNMSLDLWEMTRFKTEDILERWGKIYDNAKDDGSVDASYFLSDCMDVLYEKVRTLAEPDRNRVLDRANSDMNAYEERYKRDVITNEFADLHMFCSRSF